MKTERGAVRPPPNVQRRRLLPQRPTSGNEYPKLHHGSCAIPPQPFSIPPPDTRRERTTSQSNPPISTPISRRLHKPRPGPEGPSISCRLQRRKVTGEPPTSPRSASAKARTLERSDSFPFPEQSSPPHGGSSHPHAILHRIDVHRCRNAGIWHPNDRHSPPPSHAPPPPPPPPLFRRSAAQPWHIPTAPRGMTRKPHARPPRTPKRPPVRPSHSSSQRSDA